MIMHFLFSRSTISNISHKFRANVSTSAFGGVLGRYITPTIMLVVFTLHSMKMDSNWSKRLILGWNIRVRLPMEMALQMAIEELI